MRGQYGNARTRHAIGAATAADPLALAQQFDEFASAIAAYLSRDAGWKSRRGWPDENQRLADMQVARQHLVDLGIDADAATQAQVDDYLKRARELRAQAAFWKNPQGGAPPLPRAPDPARPAPAPRPMPPMPQGGSAPPLPGQVAAPVDSHAPPLPPGGPLERVKQTWNRIPQGDRTALKVGALATGAVAVAAIVVAIAVKAGRTAPAG